MIATLTLWVISTGLYAHQDALRHAAFNVVSVVTTGYAKTDCVMLGRCGPFSPLATNDTEIAFVAVAACLDVLRRLWSSK